MPDLGLGGTSLLNANVFLEADSKTLAMSVWPEELRKPKALERCTITSSTPMVPFHTNKITQIINVHGICFNLNNTPKIFPICPSWTC